MVERVNVRKPQQNVELTICVPNKFNHQIPGKNPDRNRLEDSPA